MRRKSRIILITGMSMVTIVICLVAYARIATRLPDLSGPYQIGKMEYHLIDSSRKEVLIDKPDAKREVMITIYYPAQPPSQAQPAPYAEGPMLEVLAKTYGVPKPLVAFIRPRSQSFANAPFATAQPSYPVLLFSHGLGVPTIFYSAVLEDIASRGYVVAAIWHTFSCSFTVFPDGRVTLVNKAGTNTEQIVENEKDLWPLRERLGGIWLADVLFILNQLTRLNESDQRLARRLNLTNTGIFGHSFGGKVGIAAAMRDSRFKAVINIDGGIDLHLPTEDRFARPFMLMRSEDPKLSDDQLKMSGMTRQSFENMQAAQNDRFRKFYERFQPAYHFRLKGSAHFTYVSDWALVAPAIPTLITKDQVGYIGGSRAVRIYNAFIAAFFNKHLKGMSEPLLNGSSKEFPEVVFESHQ
jgi:Platelet-activating factor acetylhydrolase, isoform II